MMMKFTFENYITGLACGARGSYSCPMLFGARCAQKYEELLDKNNASTSADNLSCMQELISVLQRRAKTERLSEEDVLEKLLTEDLEKVLDFAARCDAELLEPHSISRAADEILSIARSMGFNVAELNIRIVEDFPAPHSGATFAAMSYDSVDQKDFGIPMGVALKADALRPLYSQVILGHEFGHFVIGQTPTSILARGMEEGIVDYLGGVMMMGKLIGREIAEDVVTSIRTRHDQPQFWRIYRDGLLATAGFLLLQGESGFLEAMKRANRDGREVVKEIEKSLLSGNLQRKVHNDDGGRAFAQKVISLSPDNVLSPVAFYVCRSAKAGEEIAAVADRLRLSADSAARALEIAQNEAFMSVPYKGRVFSNEGPFYYGANALRYRL